MRTRLNAELGFAAFLTLATLFLVVTAAGYSSKARLIPLVVGLPTLALAAFQVWGMMKKPAADHACEVDEDEDVVPCADEKLTPRTEARSLAWVVGCFASIWILGFLVGLPLYAFLYAKVRGGEGWLLSLIPAAVSFAVLYGVFVQGLHVPLYEGVVPLLLAG